MEIEESKSTRYAGDKLLWTKKKEKQNVGNDLVVEAKKSGPILASAEPNN